jgi:hypothetical protein
VRVGQLFRKNTNQHILSGFSTAAGIDVRYSVLCCGPCDHSVAAISLNDQERQKRVRDDTPGCEVVTYGTLPHFE